eukprot:PhF_6_TR13234/c7_g1_i1/m.20945
MSFPAPPKSKTSLPETVTRGSTPKHSVPPTPTTMPPDLGISTKDRKIPVVDTRRPSTPTGPVVPPTPTTMPPDLGISKKDRKIPVVETKHLSTTPGPLVPPTPTTMPPDLGRIEKDRSLSSLRFKRSPLHTHVLAETHDRYVCANCDNDVDVSYRCKDCDFDLCERCSELTHPTPMIRHHGGGVLVGHPHPGIMMGHPGGVFPGVLMRFR